MSLDLYVLTPIMPKQKEFGDIVLSDLTKEEANVFEKILPNCAVLDTHIYYDYKKHWEMLGYKETPQIRFNEEECIVEYIFWDDIVGYYSLIEPISTIPVLERGERYEVHVKVVDDFSGSSSDFIDSAPTGKFYTKDNLSEFLSKVRDDLKDYWNRIDDKDVIFLEW